MTGAPAEQLSRERYLAMDLASEGKLEYAGGVVVAMAGASPRHNAVSINVATQLRSLLPQHCHVFGSDQRVRVDDTDAYLYPDVSVACGDEMRFSDERPRSLITPSLIVEVLSRSTAANDRGAKLAHYRRSPSVREVLLVATRERKVESYRRLETGQWLITDVSEGSLELPGFGISLRIEAIYAGVDELPFDDEPGVR